MYVTEMLIIREIKYIIGFSSDGNFLFRYFYESIKCRSFDDMKWEGVISEICEKLIGSHFDDHILNKTINTL